MKPHVLGFLTLALAAAATLPGCRTARIYDVRDRPFAFGSAGDLGLEVAGYIIRAAAAERGWMTRTETAGILHATRSRGRYSATVRIEHDASRYSIVYYASMNLSYSGSRIHKTYNAWVRDLQTTIREMSSAAAPPEGWKSFAERREAQRSNIIVFREAPTPAQIPELVRVIPPPACVKFRPKGFCSAPEVDGEQVRAYEFYVSPGSHTYSFELSYRSGVQCSGHEADSAAGMRGALLLGRYSIDLTAQGGQTIEFVPRLLPRCKYRLEDFFRIEIHGGGLPRRVLDEGLSFPVGTSRDEPVVSPDAGSSSSTP